MSAVPSGQAREDLSLTAIFGLERMPDGSRDEAARDMTRPSTRMTLAGTALPPRPWAPNLAWPHVAAPGTVRREWDWVAGRLAMSRAFRLHTGDDRRDALPVLVAYRPGGRPYLPAAPALWCSIAHSHGWAIAGISSCPIGVDIEKIRRHHPALLLSVASAAEISRVAARVADPEHVVTVLWTIKEAAMKATGEGLGIPPRRVRIVEFDGRSAQVTVTAASSFPAELRVTTVRRDSHYLSIAQPEGSDEIPRVDWH